MLKDKAMIKMLDDVKSRSELFEEEMDVSNEQIRRLKKENLELRQNNKMLQEELNNLPQTIYDYYTDIVDTDDIAQNLYEISKVYYEIMTYLTNID